MTGSRHVAYVHEPADDYLGSPTDTTYKLPGKNVTVKDVSLSNALQRMRLPNDPQAVETVAGSFEGAFEATWTLTTPWFHNHVFGGAPSQSGSSAPYTYTWSFPESGGWQVQGSRWYLGVELSSGAVERALKGVVFGQLDVNCSVGETVQVTAMGFYADEERNPSITPGTVSGGDAEAMVFEGGSLEIPDSSSLGMLQDATLNINTGARPQRGWQRKPLGAVLGAVDTTLDVSKIIQDDSQLSLAYGGGSSPSTGNVDGEPTGKLTFSTSGSAELTYDMTGVTPNQYNWQNLADADADVLEDLTYYVDGVEAVATSDESSAL